MNRYMTSFVKEYCVQFVSVFVCVFGRIVRSKFILYVNTFSNVIKKTETRDQDLFLFNYIFIHSENASYLNIFLILLIDDINQLCTDHPYPQERKETGTQFLCSFTRKKTRHENFLREPPFTLSKFPFTTIS